MSNTIQSKSHEGMPEDPIEWKIFPRNLTARADYIVPGNPTVSRPEDGVDNCYPGLEMDAKNIEKYFFNGLYFEVYYDFGAKLKELTPKGAAKPWVDLGLGANDLTGNVYLWMIKGRTQVEQSVKNPPVTSLLAPECHSSKIFKEGLYCWRVARDLFPGKVAIVIGGKDTSCHEEALEALEKAWKTGKSVLVRDKGKNLTWGVLVGERARYLDENGVLDPDVYQPGELTRTLCTPWTYDFRDCQCFYWASNKPDVISGEDGKYPYLNFQRKNRDVEPQTEDIAYDYPGRRLREIDYAEMMTDWEQLRLVVNGREQGQSYRPADPPRGPLLSLEEIRTEVEYLATVEHALAVQYLYAYYSVDAPEQAPEDPQLREFRLYEGTQEIFNIAVDEMRHFKWANEISKIIGGKVTAKRATKLGRSLRVPFYLQSLASPQLQWFVDVERPSRSTLVGLDGMYVGILESLQHLSDAELDPEARRRAVEITKLIIDEGEGHYVRFSTIQQNLAFYDQAGRGSLPEYIRQGQWRVEQSAADRDPSVPITPLYGAPKKECPGTALRKLQLRSDSHYQALVILLRVAFSMDAETGGKALRSAIGLMFKMDAVNKQLAGMGSTPLFVLPKALQEDPPVKNERDARSLVAEAKKLLGKDVMNSSEVFGVGTHRVSMQDLFVKFEDCLCHAKFHG